VKARRVARPAILRSIPGDRHAVIEASAGTGKTFTLEHLVVDLLLTADVTLDRVLVVTFTEKATNELRARVRATLERLLSPASTETDSTGLDGATGDFWNLGPRDIEKLRAARAAFDAATITTIHAFCQRVLRENAFHSGRLFDETQVDGRDAFGRAFREALRRDIAPHPDRAPWLETALRGGWDIDRIEDLLWTATTARGEIRPEFDAGVLARAVDAYPCDEARRLTHVAALKAAGLHASSATTAGCRMNELADAVEVSRGEGLTRFIVECSAIKNLAQLERLRTVRLPPGPTERLCTAALALVDAAPPFPAALVHTFLPVVSAELDRRKRDAGEYDFDDMLSRVDEALQGPGGHALIEALRRRWRYALIDEFQDTDEIQWRIFRRAFFERAASPSVLYLVGDPKQSIYRFRGADVETYLAAREEIQGAGGARVSLSSSYRATPLLVGALNAIFDQAVAEPVFTGSVTYEPVSCGRPDRRLVDGDGREVAPVHLFRTEGAAGPEKIGPLIAREIRAITTPGRSWRLDGVELALSDVFILTRTRFEGRTVAEYLRQAGIPYAFFKEDGLFQTDEARDVRTLLRAIEDPLDRARRFAAWLTPFFGLSLAALEDARDLPSSHPHVARLAAWKALADAREYGRLFESIVRDSGILRREIFFEDGERELTNYLHVFELLLEHARRTRGTLRELCLEVHGLIEKTRRPLDMEGDVQRIESEKRAVQIMTIHKSKGLEAPVVFVAGGVRGSRANDSSVRVYHEADQRLAFVGSPSGRVKDEIKQEEREEDERLMYVALTRAQGRLYLPCAVKSGGPASLSGPHQVVNPRLVVLARAGAPWLSVEDVAAVDAVAVAAPPSHAPDVVPVDILHRGKSGGPSFDALREARAGVYVTSYTRMSAQRRRTSAPRSALAAHSGWAEAPEARRAQKAAESVDASGAVLLRGSRATGVFLHELLERADLASLAAATGFDAWRARPEVARLLDETIAVHRVERAAGEHAARMVWAAYTTPLVLPTGDRIEGLARADLATREMDFVYPIPGSPLGYVRGSLDLAFEHGKKTYYVDWKSDSLPSYAPEALETHVRAHYDKQVKLYTLAVGKLLGVDGEAAYDARFGGILYCFLRGMDAPARGVWSARPRWADVIAWERELGEEQG
jgi:exodeoxyribonuclease V beta subunit